ncbi:MAG: MotA/TolQ/ExbB proton channel family protein [Planctomycetota bacterium]|nr:MotA/TolQ/ExbB proton channel family protein [Planctomycetota bacterium]
MERLMGKQSRTRLFWVLVMMFLAIGAVATLSNPITLSAQEGGDAAAAADGGADADAAAEGENEGGSSASQPPSNALYWLLDSLGPLYIIVFLLLSFIFVALCVMNLLTARRDGMCPMHLIEGFETCLNEQQYQEAYEMAKSDESILGNVLSAGLAKLSTGYDEAIEAMQEVGEEEDMKLEHRLSYINLIAQISPMVGLFGTVHGMIAAFYEIAVGGATPDPNKLADGISKALLTTLIGLFVAIPALAVFRILRNRVQRMMLEIGITSEGLMSRFQSASPKKAP